MGNVVSKEPCPDCRAKGGDTAGDNLARYDDGGAYCFACGYDERPTSGAPPAKTKSSTSSGDKKISAKIDEWEYRPLIKRGIDEETCKKFGYGVGKYNAPWDEDVHGKFCHAVYLECDGHRALKVRFANKDFRFSGATKKAGLFGQHLWRDGGKQIVITEGEIDCMSISQLQNNKWPCCSIPNGTKAAAGAISAQIEWLEKFDKVIFMFDMDDVGQEAAKECAALLSPGKAYIARLPLKDPNECLLAGKGKELLAAMWDAKEYRPDGLVSIDDIMEQAEKPIEWGLPWCLETLTKLTYGRRDGEVYGFGGGTGSGKTDLFTQQIEFDINKLSEHVGVIYLEQPCAETAKRIAGKADGKRYHVPDAGHTPEELKAALQKLRGKVTFYDNFGRTEWDVVAGKVRYMVRGLGIRLIYLDHLTALADPANEKESLEIIMEEMAMLAKELGCIIHYVSHLTTPEGKPHEEGGRVMIRHFKGSRSIGFWSYFMFGIERNQQSNKPTTLRVLKDRYTGQATGQCIGLRYDKDTGILHECALEVESEKHGFAAEASGDSEF